MWSLTDTGSGYHLRALNMTTILSPTFPSGIIHNHLIAPTGLILNHLPSTQILKSFYMNQKGIKALNLMSGTIHLTSTVDLSTKHSSANGFPPR
jgi:hypothetical protein